MVARQSFWHRKLKLAVLALVLFSSLGVLKALAQTPSAIAWPPPPQDAKIVYKHSFSSAADLGWKRGWWRKVLDWMMYGDDPSLLQRPFAVAFDDNRRMIVADLGAHDVKVFDPAKRTVKRIRGYKDKMFGVPISLAVDSAQNIYVADAAAGRVLKYDTNGKFLSFIGGEEGAFKHPASIAFNKITRQLYVLDTQRPKLFVYSEDGTLVQQFGSRGLDAGQFNFPTFICVDQRGQVYVNDTLNFRIQVFTPELKVVRMLGSLGNGTGNMSRTKGIAVDSEGHIYAGDGLFSTIQIFDANGDFLLNFGSEGDGPAQFYIPGGTTIDILDYIYVADPYNGRVQVFHYVGKRASDAQPFSPGGHQ